VLAAVASPWAVWGSAVFHWALLVLMVAAVAGTLLRAEGSMAIPVGETKADAPTSYVAVTAGPLHDWGRVHRSIRVDALAPDFKTGGIDRGAAPTVSVLDSAGKLVIKQRVYPNAKLHAGSLSIDAPSVGLAATVALIKPSGAELGRFVELVDFSQTTTGGTVPVVSHGIRDNAGNLQLRLRVTVPLDRVDGHYGEWIPKQPAARVVLISGDGATLLDSMVHQGEQVAIPGGGAVRLVGIGWYSNLAITDDPTIPFIYGSMVVAMLGLTLTVVARQQLLVAAVVEGPDGPKLAMRLRLWRNESSSRGEIERELTRALGGVDDEGGTG
jgi:cytochrome c biogenesis protein ResB